MHLLGEYYDEREWLLDFTSSHYVIRKEDLMNASGYEATKSLKEMMSNMYLNCAKYDRMFRECANTFGAALITDQFYKDHADCNRILTSLKTCIWNNQWFHENKKYHPEDFNHWRGKDYKGHSDNLDFNSF